MYACTAVPLGNRCAEEPSMFNVATVLPVGSTTSGLSGKLFALIAGHVPSAQGSAIPTSGAPALDCAGLPSPGRRSA